ncbi:MAG: response regulator [Pyrinomonadaceae bacterium]|nr:response regulator [Pyrinomonadaceae bacterium]MCX7640290.1 response regulator [Pyrinomonadaceae bacterium]MDW8305262.1 response regulator [Acidobacteriota bacterium]
MQKLKVIIADDERPARNFLKNLLADFEDVEVIGEAENGAETVEIIKRMKPDLILLDLQMPEVTGLDVVKLLNKAQLPLIAFVTAYDEYAVQAFEINAIDYLLKPVEKSRLRETIQRAHERLERNDFRQAQVQRLDSAIKVYEATAGQGYLERIPVKKREEIFLVPVREVASIVADGELLNITTISNNRYVINYRLKEIEARLDPSQFIRISRGALVNLEMIAKISPMPGGTYILTLKNGQSLPVSRLQSRVLRERFLKM